MKFLISTVLVWFYVKHVFIMACSWNTECKFNYFSSKTPYEIIRGDLRDSIVRPKGCEPISIWSIMRHGKRSPSKKFAKNMKGIIQIYTGLIEYSYKIENSSLCAQDVENIVNWKVETDVLDVPYELSKEGYREIMGISRRLKETFPELLNELQEKDYILLPGFGNHLHKSAIAFADGLSKNNIVIANANGDYSVVAPYSTCGKYQTEVRRNPNIYYQANIYETTMDYLNMKERVEKHLGLNFTLSNENITAMYDLCRYTWDGINKTPSPWCAVFSTEDLEVLEYIDDLKHYYRNGYGTKEYSKQLGQMPLADLFRKFKQARNGKGKKIVSYFSHATMMDMILVVLHLYKDSSPLTGAYRDINRKWRVTFTSTFSSNMVAVLNRCSENGANNYDYNVALYWNERPLLELCQKGVCSWQEFEDIFKPFLNATIDLCEFEWTQKD